jgi:ribosomal protein L16 Arg81 hydroxylase
MDKLIKKLLKEQSDRYMFFSNLEQMRRQCDLLLDLERDMVDSILDNGHDWAQDHIAEAKNNLDQVFDFLMNETKQEGDMMEDDNILDDMSMAMANKDPNEALALYQMNEGRKKSGTKLCARGKAAAKAKFKVWPSAYGNGFAVQVCQGRMKGLDGKKRCSPPYC